MAGFDDSVFDKPLNAETKTRTQRIREWVQQKADDIECLCTGGNCNK